jgi:tRNA-specific 2-thiouridylase
VKFIIIQIMIKSNLSKEQTTIVVAMSGGVDSSTVAAMLHDEGYKIIGITLQLYNNGANISKKGACCAGQDIYDAKMVADRLGVPHYVLDYETKFQESVINDFADSYIRGETPLPCAKCNQSVKFKDLLEMAKDLGAHGLATGHYVRKINGKNGSELHIGIDPQKDQSYFLFSTTQAQLDYLHFPLGHFTKEETRNMAQKFGLAIADKPDSQDICFVPNGNYRDIISKLKPGALHKGKIIHIAGFELGTHDGIMNYTIGQRRGLGISFSDPLYVIKIDPELNIVYVGPESALDSTQFIIKEVNWLDSNELVGGMEVSVKIRSTRKATIARIHKIDQGRILVKLLSPEQAVSPGQACVIYDHERMIGGGWITKDIIS